MKKKKLGKRIKKLELDLAEARETLFNERGAGYPPAPGWSWQWFGGWLKRFGDVEILIQRSCSAPWGWVNARGGILRGDTARETMLMIEERMRDDAQR